MLEVKILEAESVLSEVGEYVTLKGEKGDKGEKGADGAQGLKGDKGDKGDGGYTPQKGVDYFTPEDIAGLNIPSVDQTYAPDSESAQSGKAVAEAVEPKADKIEVNKLKEDTAALQKRQNVLVGSETGSPISCDDAFAAPLCGLHIYGKSTQVTTTGAQLLSVNRSNTVVGISIDLQDCIATFTGTVIDNPTVRPSINANVIDILEVGKTYQCYVYDDTVVFVDFEVNIDGIITYPGNRYTVLGTESEVRIRIIYGAPITTAGTIINHTCKVGLYDVDNPLSEWEPYTGGIPSPNPQYPQPLESVGDSGSVEVSITDGTEDNVQSLTLQTPNGLPGIPVTDASLVTYTDADGQMWCADEIDLERGVYVQRVLVIEDLESLSRFYSFTTSDGMGITVQYDAGCTLINTYVYCTHYPYLPNNWQKTNNTICVGGNAFSRIQFSVSKDVATTGNEFKEFINNLEEPVKVLACLAEPIETPLTDSEIAAYKALTTYAPDTVVQATDGAGIKLKYQRDVNIAIKKLEDAIASITTT